MKLNLSQSYDRLPTLKQWASKLPAKKKLPPSFGVQVIWFPNLYPGLTIETSVFRVKINAGPNDLEKLIDLLKAAIANDQEIFFVWNRTEPEDIEFRFSEHSNAEWVAIGESGYKNTVSASPDNPLA